MCAQRNSAETRKRNFQIECNLSAEISAAATNCCHSIRVCMRSRTAPARTHSSTKGKEKNAYMQIEWATQRRNEKLVQNRRETHASHGFIIIITGLCSLCLHLICRFTISHVMNWIRARIYLLLSRSLVAPLRFFVVVFSCLRRSNATALDVPAMATSVYVFESVSVFNASISIRCKIVLQLLDKIYFVDSQQDS